MSEYKFEELNTDSALRHLVFLECTVSLLIILTFPFNFILVSTKVFMLPSGSQTSLNALSCIFIQICMYIIDLYHLHKC